MIYEYAINHIRTWIFLYLEVEHFCSGGLGGLVIDNDLEKPEVDRINIFHTFVKQKIQVQLIFGGKASDGTQSWCV